MKNSKKKKPPLTVKITHEINVNDVLAETINKYGAKLLLKHISGYCCINYIHYTHTLALTLANEKDVENSIAGQILLYVTANWDKVSKEAIEFFDKKMSEVET